MNANKRSHTDAHFKTKMRTSVFDFKWTIENFDKVFPSNSTINSDVFFSKCHSNFEWNLSMKLTEENHDDLPSSSTEKFISVYANCNDNNASFMKLNLDLCILKNQDVQCHKVTFQDQTPSKSKSFGIENFITLEELTDPNQNYLQDGSLNLYIEITLTYFVNSLDSCNHRCVQEAAQTCADGSCFSVLFRNEDFSDLTVICDDVRILVHKNVLAAKSQVLYNKLKKFQGNELELPVPLALGQELLSFIYTGKCANLKEYYSELYESAIKLKIPDLEKLVENYLRDTLTVETASSRLIWAEENKHQGFKDTVIDFINRNIRHVFDRKDFQSLLENRPKLTKELFCLFVETYVKDSPET